MTMHTPVVLTDDSTVAAAARARSWPVVQQQDGMLRITGVEQTVPLPEPAMSIERGSLTGPHVAGWKLVLDWLEKHVHRPMMVVAPNGWAQDLALWSASSRGWPLGAWVHGDPPARTDAGAVALLGTATGVLIPDAEQRESFIHSWPAAMAELPDAALVDVAAPAAPTPSVRREGHTSVLLVAHSTDDSPAAGSDRAASLLATLKTLASEGLSVDLATTSRPSDATERIHHVPDLGPATLSAGRGPIETWATVAFTHAAKKAYAPTHEVGGYWHVALERYFEARDDHFDIVIMTGDPVEPFAFAAWAQDHWYARTVLDYGNPSTLADRRGLSSEAAAEAADVECGWNMAADLVLVADSASLDMVAMSGPQAVVEVFAPTLENENSGATRELGRLITKLAPAGENGADRF